LDRNTPECDSVSSPLWPSLFNESLGNANTEAAGHT
jgi:hypothetical protein